MWSFSSICLTAALAVPACLQPLIPAAAQPPRNVLTEGRAAVPAAPWPNGEKTVGAVALHSVLGIEVRTNAEQSVGRTVDLLVYRSGHVEAAIIEFGGFLGMGARKVAVAWPALRLETSGAQTLAVIGMSPEGLAAPRPKPPAQARRRRHRAREGEW